jgi:hypothetical protein
VCMWYCVYVKHVCVGIILHHQSLVQYQNDSTLQHGIEKIYPARYQVTYTLFG